MFIAICWILFSYLIGKYAKDRGESFWTYAILSGVLSPITGFVIVLIKTSGSKPIPKQNSAPASSQQQHFVQPEQKSEVSFEFCPNCGSKVMSHFTHCPNCGSSLK